MLIIQNNMKNMKGNSEMKNLINIPDDLIEPCKKITNALDTSKKAHGLRGLNISQLAKETNLPKYTLNKALGVLETIGEIECEVQGRSKVYYRNMGVKD